MKYRIRIEGGKYRAEIGKENRFGKLLWIPIEDDNEDLCARCIPYNTIEEAEEACKLHHIECGYDKLNADIVKTFEL